MAVRDDLMVEELGRRKINHGDLYVLRFYNRLDETKKGEIACGTAGEAQKWMEAFDHAKQQAEYELSRGGGSARNKLNMETEINLEGHRPRVKRYAHGLRNLIRIGQGPEMLLRQSSVLGARVRTDRYIEGDNGDAVEAHEWKCVHTINGVRIFEDVADSQSGKDVLVKSVGVVDATADTVFEVILNIERHQRYEWDTLTGDLELIDSYDGHYDVLYGILDPKYHTRWLSRRDFIFSRQWFRGQDGAYTILQFPAVHKEKPVRSGYRRKQINPSTWEIRSLSTPLGSNAPKCIEIKVKLKNVSWALTILSLMRTSDANKELDLTAIPITINPTQFHGSLHKGKDDTDTNCWTSPSGMGFMIRGKTYLQDNSKVMGGDPLLKLIAVDWFKVDKPIDKIALHPKCIVQSEIGKRLPFILVINLQVPAKPNYSLVLYYAADRPVKKSSLLAKFVDGSDIFRDARLKLIPSIIEGYWMVKRAVGTKACLLGKAVTCKYVRQDNFLEIDVDIGSSSVARSVIGLVLGYVTSIVVDLAILIEGKEETELPEYILGAVRINRLRPDSAVHLEV